MSSSDSTAGDGDHFDGAVILGGVVVFIAWTTPLLAGSITLTQWLYALPWVLLGVVCFAILVEIRTMQEAPAEVRSDSVPGRNRSTPEQVSGRLLPSAEVRSWLWILGSLLAGYVAFRYTSVGSLEHQFAAYGVLAVTMGVLMLSTAVWYVVDPASAKVEIKWLGRLGRADPLGLREGEANSEDEATGTGERNGD